MTTNEAAKRYEQEHVARVANRGWAVFNPNELPEGDLPIIYGFNNGGSPGWYSAVLLAEDGTCLGGHVCSSEAYMPHDLGILEGSRPDRHEGFREHYPGGYRMEFVGHNEVGGHGKLQVVFAINEQQGDPK